MKKRRRSVIADSWPQGSNVLKRKVSVQFRSSPLWQVRLLLVCRDPVKFSYRIETALADIPGRSGGMTARKDGHHIEPLRRSL